MMPLHNGCWDLEAMTSIGEIKARSQLRLEYSGIIRLLVNCPYSYSLDLEFLDGLDACLRN